MSAAADSALPRDPDATEAAAPEAARPPVLAITGPTAVGKTELALAVAAEVPAEIVSADAMAVYRGMDVGTAKPTAAQRARAVFHLVDTTAPDRPYSLARFLDDARAAVADIAARGRLPILCGGTGLYVSALLRGYALAPQEPEAAGRVRADLMQRLAREGLEALAADLARRDPETAARLDLRNPRRVVRALELIALSGRPLADVRRAAAAAPYRSVCAVVTMPRRRLYPRIEQRVEAMLAAGWLGETRRLVEEYGPTRALRDAIGYGRLLAHLAGEAGWDQTVEAIERDTRRYAKRQLTWWRHDPGARWMPWETRQDFAATSAALARMGKRLLRGG